MGAPAPGNDFARALKERRGLPVVPGTTGRTSCGTPERLRPSITCHATPPRTAQHVPPPTVHSCAEFWPWITRGARSPRIVVVCRHVDTSAVRVVFPWCNGWWYGDTGIFSDACHLDSETWRFMTSLSEFRYTQALMREVSLSARAPRSCPDDIARRCAPSGWLGVLVSALPLPSVKT